MAVISFVMLARLPFSSGTSMVSRNPFSRAPRTSRKS